MGAPVDHRKGPRRRGAVLEQAIFDATLAELSEVGYAGLTMDAVVRRAKTSKSSVHRRWGSVAALVIDALAHAKSERLGSIDTGELRNDLLELLRSAATRLAGPSGAAARGLIAERLRDPELAELARTRVVDVPPGEIVAILRRAVERGEARPEALDPRVATVGPVLLRHHFLVHGTPIPDHVIVEIVDKVVLPLVRR